MGASKSRSMKRRGEPPDPQLYCSSPGIYRGKQTGFRVVSSHLTAEEHPRSLRIWKQAAGVGPRVIHRFWRMATNSRSGWLHKCSRVGKKGTGGRDGRRGCRDPSRAESKMIMERLLLSPDQVAESLGVCRSRVYDLMRTRVLPSVKIGRSRRVPASAVRAYVDQLSDSWDVS
jgi:excisionase family DNA binding protein